MDICKHWELCGGCQSQGVPYEAQLEAKEAAVSAELARTRVLPERRDPIVPSPQVYGYRNKMEYTFGDLVKDGPLGLGLHRKGSFMSIVTVDGCQLVHEDFNRILSATLEFCRPYPKYHKKSHEGLLRNLILRRGAGTGELLVNLVTSSTPGFDEAGFVRMILDLPLEHQVVGILRTLNDGISDAVRCDELKVLFGRDHYFETVLGLTFKVSAFSFFQANVPAIGALYEQALSLLKNPEGKVVYDLYCGTGTITQALARRAALAVGVELVEESVLAARENSRLNDLQNCEFLAGDVFEILDKTGESLPRPDVIVVDPPRAGVGDKALRRILAYGVEEIVYISCNPVTLADNLAAFREGGYRVDYLRAYDNFPHTRHIEALCLLRRNPAGTDVEPTGETTGESI
jgi:23S rRNA (uracil-5-)-methyltransferase RumA